MLPDCIHHWALVVGEGSGAKYIELRAPLPHESDLLRKDIFISKLLYWKDREVPDFWILNDEEVVGYTNFGDDAIQDTGKNNLLPLHHFAYDNIRISKTCLD
jgi:hypothetical protein